MGPRRRTVLLAPAFALSAAFAGVHASSAGNAAPAAAVAAAQATPNVVVIMLDDMRYDDLSTLPRIRSRIGDAGATFTHFYSPFPLCCPARSTLLTGEYAHNHGVLSNTAPTGGYHEFDDTSTLATWMTATYRTGLIGKYLNGYFPPYRPPGWDEWIVPKNMYGYYNKDWYVRRDAAGGYQSVPGYATDTMGQFAAEFITRNATSTTPFFLYTNLVAPHEGQPADPDDISGFPTPFVKPSYRDTFKGLQSTDPSFNEADVSDKPVRPSLLSQAEINGLTEQNAQRRESMLSAQDAVDRIMDALQTSGELNDTFVVFMSDNGYVLGEHRIRGGKLAPYEVANRVPLMIRGPGIAAGTRIDTAASQVDFAPTVMAMAGLSAPASVDGVSLLNAARSPGTTFNHPPIVIEATDTKATTDPLPWMYRGVVQDGWKYVARTTGKKELYDLTSDPYELQNLAGKAAYATRQQQLAQLLAQYQSCAGAGCR
jgi:N-acetylglucosamine-6-sulfatase